MLIALILCPLLLLQSAVAAGPAEIRLDFIATVRGAKAVTDLSATDITLKVGRQDGLYPKMRLSGD